MSDVYQTILENLSNELPNSYDRALLKKLIEVQRENGIDGIEKYLDECLEEIKGD